MANQHDVHVVPNRSRSLWRVKQNGRVLSNHRSQGTAMSVGRRVANRSHVDLLTHGRDGRIRSKDSYGNESPARDTEH